MQTLEGAGCGVGHNPKLLDGSKLAHRNVAMGRLGSGCTSDTDAEVQSN
jgi:hypothetical protein